MVEPAAFVGQVIDGRWQLVTHVGSGHFGEVYAAEPRHLDIAAGAVKILRPTSDRERELILREIRALSELQHERLLGYRDAGEIHDGVLAGSIYIVTELCDGALVDEPGWGAGGADFETRLAHAMVQMAEALGYLHGRGLIHRDVKPANILRQGDDWKLSDFGLVRDHTEPISVAYAAQGTGPYLAPETTKPTGAGPPADIYALGVVVHEALTGTWPYDTDIRTWSAPPLTAGASIALSPVLPDHWRAPVELCLQHDPRRRPTAAELVPLIPDPTTAAADKVKPPTRSSQTATVDTLPPGRSSKRPWLIAAALAIAIISAAGIAITVSDGDGETSPEVTEPEPSAPVTSAGRATTGKLLIDQDTTLVQNHDGEIEITADNVTLDCAGHTVTGSGDGPGPQLTPSAVRIESLTGVTVENCHVTNFFDGISVHLSTDIVVRDNSATEMGEAGFAISESTVTLTNNEANDNDAWGFFVTGGSAGTKLIGNVASGNDDIGYALNSGAPGVEVTGNHASGNRIGFADTVTGGAGTLGTDNVYSCNTCTGNEIQSTPEDLC